MSLWNAYFYNYFYDCNFIFTGWNHGLKHFNFSFTQLTIFKFKYFFFFMVEASRFDANSWFLKTESSCSLSSNIITKTTKTNLFVKPFGLQIVSVLYPVTICPAWAALTNKKWWLMNAQRAWHVLTKHPLTTARLNKQPTAKFNMKCVLTAFSYSL